MTTGSQRVKGLGSHALESPLLATYLGFGYGTVARVWREHGIQPCRSETFKFSTDPELVAKVTDIVGPHLDPPENAIVLCVDEKSQIRHYVRTAPPRCSPH